tara:strand:- start:226 stop:468 length:243 start_codon:yes stop_codon:yes gene_type:complete
MCWLVGRELHEFAELPSGGDNSYPGFVAITPTEAVMSWYSSHEGKSSIYMADLEVRTNETVNFLLKNGGNTGNELKVEGK